MAYFTKKNAKIFYEIYGEGNSCITLINGYTRPSSDFKLLGSFLAEHSRKVFCFDNRGCGRTEAALDFSIEDLVRDVIDLWDELEILESHVLGISMGGLIAQLLSLQAEERVRSLCLVSTSTHPAIFTSGFQWSSKESEIVLQLEKYFHKNFLEKNKLLIEAMARQIGKQNQSGEFESKARAQRVAVAKTKVDEDALKSISIPTLILQGLDDKIIPVSEAKKLATLIRNSKLHIYKDTGHMILVEQKNDFYRRILDFIESTS